MNHLNSYPSIYALGHRSIREIFSGPVTVEEKVDGSQFSMWRRAGGELVCRSKGQQIVIDAPEKMFIQAVDSAKSLDLHEGWIYRCEYLKSPKHNTLSYSRTPFNNLAVFDICSGIEEYLDPAAKLIECQRIGLEVVPLIYSGVVGDISQIESFLELESFLGGCKIEGVVVKNYSLFTHEKKVAIGKFVSEDFKEKHGKEWKASNPTAGDFVLTLTQQLRTEARWRKGVQHLREAGLLTDTPADIGPLMKEVSLDLHKEEADEIKESLFKHFWPKIARGATAGLPEFYKAELAKKAFELGEPI